MNIMKSLWGLTILSKFIVVFATSQNGRHTDCKCWERAIHRKSCHVGAFANQDDCIEAGCCYDDVTHYVYSVRRPHCYKKKGTCPQDSQCIIPAPHREGCGHHGMGRVLCEMQGCCFEDSQHPSCYKKKRYTTFYYEAEKKYYSAIPSTLNVFPVQPTISTYFPIPLSTTQTLMPDVEGPQEHFDFDGLKVFFQCPRHIGTSCGRNILDKETCIANYCCWNPRNRGTKHDPCFLPYINVTKSTALELSKWGDWSSWSLCGGKECSLGEQTRNRTCFAEFDTTPKNCAGNSIETRRCIVLCPPAWATWQPWAPCTSFCGPGMTLRSRECIFNGLKIYANNCPGRSVSAMDVQMCHKDLCHEWSPWKSTPCSSTCGVGVIIKYRSCHGKEKQRTMEGCHKQVTACESKFCQFTPHMTWGPWSGWSDCSKGCEKRYRSKSRSCFVFISKNAALPEQYTSCIGGVASSRKTEDCYRDWCSHWSSWFIETPCKRSSCERDYGVERRFCKVGTSANYPASCSTRNITCSTSPCQ